MGIIPEAIGTRWRHDRHGFVSQALIASRVSFVMIMMSVIMAVIAMPRAPRFWEMQRFEGPTRSACAMFCVDAGIQMIPRSH